MATYYVKNGGSDGADGLSEGNAWATCAKVNGSVFSADDIIQFRGGDLWRERLIAPSSGSDGSPIVFTSYGPAEKPIFDGADIKTGWGAATPPRYSVSLTTECHLVFVDGVLATKGASESTLNNGEWFWLSNVLYYRSDAGNPDSIGLTIEATIREATGNEGIVEFNGKSWVTFNDLRVLHGNSYGIHSYAATAGQTGKVIQNCIVSYTANGGICLIADAEYYTASSITGNTLDHLNMKLPWGTGSSEAITIQHGDGFVVLNNVISAFMEEAINPHHGSKNGEIAYNYVSEYIGLGTRPGIYISGTDIRVHHNIVVGQHYAPSPFADAYRIHNEIDSDPVVNITMDHNIAYQSDIGITIGVLGPTNGTGIKIYHNDFVDCEKDGLYFPSAATDNFGGTLEIKNNIFHDCAQFAIHDDTTGNQAIGLFTIDHNFFRTGDSSETQGSNAVVASDPLFIDSVNDDFRLKIGSPCLDRGIVIPGINDGAAGSPRFFGGNPDIGAFEMSLRRLAVRNPAWR